MFFQKEIPKKKGRSLYRQRPTVYKGKKYKSCTEARWVVFFDALHIKHWYEYRKFDLGSCRYVPDFYLPELSAWVEIKGFPPSEGEVARIKAVAEITGENVFLFFDAVQHPQCGGKYAYGYIWRNGELYGDQLFTWALCPVCQQYNISLLGRSNELPCLCLADAGKQYGDEGAELRAAFTLAANYFKAE